LCPTRTDAHGNIETIDLLGHKIIDACIDEQNNRPVFKTSIMSREVWVVVPAGNTLRPATLVTKLRQAPSGAINVPAQKGQHARVRDFFVAWITQQQQRKTITVSCRC
jgi:hypothetical protein